MQKVILRVFLVTEMHFGDLHYVGHFEVPLILQVEMCARHSQDFQKGVSMLVQDLCLFVATISNYRSLLPLKKAGVASLLTRNIRETCKDDEVYAKSQRVFVSVHSARRDFQSYYESHCSSQPNLWLHLHLSHLQYIKSQGKWQGHS